MALSGLVTLILVLAVIGFCLWLIITYIPMPSPFKNVIIVIVVIVVILYLLSLLTGGLGPLRIR